MITLQYKGKLIPAVPLSSASREQLIEACGMVRQPNPNRKANAVLIATLASEGVGFIHSGSHGTVLFTRNRQPHEIT